MKRHHTWKTSSGTFCAVASPASQNICCVPPVWDKAYRSKRKQAIINRASVDDLIGPDLTSIAIMDFEGLKATVHGLQNAFPKWWRHRFAVKANSLVPVLKKLHDLGLEMEAASAGEIAACRNAGVPNDKISFNSPVKTLAELRAALADGLSLSIDNEQELKRIVDLVGSMPAKKLTSVGFRVNPQMGAGKIELTSTANPSSKFGFPLADGDSRERLIAMYSNYPWLNFLHVHMGSQGVPVEQMIAGITIIRDLALEINAFAQRKAIKIINIGGGLPIHYDPQHVNCSFNEYATALRSALPELFSGEFEVETEFGRSIVAENGLVITRVEYTKSAGGRHIAATHAGSQLAIRTALAPNDWPLAFTVLDSSGQPKDDGLVPTDIAGPCCYGGDLLCRDRLLEFTEPGDLILVHNMGAYSFSAHYEFNLIEKTKVYKVEGFDEGMQSAAI